MNEEDKYDDKHIDPFLSHTLITGILKTLAFSLGPPWYIDCPCESWLVPFHSPSDPINSNLSQNCL